MNQPAVMTRVKHDSQRSPEVSGPPRTRSRARPRRTSSSITASGLVALWVGGAQAAPFLTPAPSPPTGSATNASPAAPEIPAPAEPAWGAPPARAPYPPPGSSPAGPPPPPPYYPPAPAYPYAYPYPSAPPPYPPPYYPPPGAYRPPPWTNPSYAADREAWIRQRPGWHAHDGLYLNLGVAIAYGHNTIGDVPGRVEANGTGIAFSAALGGAITKNVILCVRATLTEMETRFVDTVRGYDVDGASAEGSLLGGGVVYYFDDSNVFLGGTIGLTSFDVRDGFGSFSDSRARFGGALEVGKEWWVSPNWGLGGALRGSYGSAKELSIANAVWTNLGVGLFLSATYN